MIRTNDKLSSICLLLAAMVILPGCMQLKTKFRTTPKASYKDPVNEILCLWEPSRGTAPDGSPARGFSAQVMFFTRGQKSPVKVSGQVVIEQFVAERGSTEFGEPIHTFRFDQKAWDAHLATGHLGPTYNVFIPLMKPGESRENCALRVRLLAPKSPPVQSEQARVVLEGTSSKKKQTAQTDEHKNERVINVSHESTERRKLRTTTIRPGVQQMRFEDDPENDPAPLNARSVNSIRKRLQELKRKRNRERSATGLDLTDSDQQSGVDG